MESSRSSASSLTMSESSSRPKPTPNLIDFLEARRQQHEHRRPRRGNNNLYSVHKTPQIHAFLSENTANSRRSFLNTCMLLSPAFAFQFCTGLTSVFSIANLNLLQIPLAVSSTHLVLASIISVGFKIACQKFIKMPFERNTHLATLLVCFTAYLSLGTLLVMAANIEMLLNSGVTTQNVTGNNTTEMTPLVLSTSQMKANDNFIPIVSDQFQTLSGIAPRDNVDIFSKLATNFTDAFFQSNMSKSSWQRVVASSPVPMYAKVLAFVGYVIMSSSLSSSHYLLCSIVTCISHLDEHSRINRIEAAVAAVGGWAVSFLGTINLFFSWNSSTENSPILISHIFILICVAVVLLIGCTACSVITWFSDAIMEKFRPIRDIEENILIGRDRRPTRTAQEIFDECSALLGHREQVAYAEDYVSPSNFQAESDEGIVHSETALDDSILASQIDESASYVLQLRVPAREQLQTKPALIFLKTRKKFIQFLSLMFLVSGCLVSVEYNSTIYLSYLTMDNNNIPGQVFMKSARTSSAGTFITYLVSIAGFAFFESLLSRPGLRAVILGSSVVASVLILTLAISSEVSAYFAVACVLGLLRVLVVNLPHLVSVQSQNGSQTRTDGHMQPPLVGCMTPLSLCLSSAMISALTEFSGLSRISLYLSTSCAILACITVSTLF